MPCVTCLLGEQAHGYQVNASSNVFNLYNTWSHTLDGYNVGAAVTCLMNSLLLRSGDSSMGTCDNRTGHAPATETDKNY